MKVIKYLCLAMLLSASQQFLASEGNSLKLKNWELLDARNAENAELQKIRSTLEEKYKNRGEQVNLDHCERCSSVKVYNDYSIELSAAYYATVSLGKADFCSTDILDENYQDITLEYGRFQDSISKHEKAGPCR